MPKVQNVLFRWIPAFHLRLLGFGGQTAGMTSQKCDAQGKLTGSAYFPRRLLSAEAMAKGDDRGINLFNIY